MAVAGGVIGVLGPLAVRGERGGLGPRDRVVLAALAVHPGEVLSAERLADALWGDAPPPSWPKVVPGCVMRLRRVLGTDAIETTPHGYRLMLPVDEVDSHRFERLLRRGQELLTLGEPDRAAFTLGEALDLWRGRPLPDLESWEPGRIEADRLIELRQQTQEYRLEAALQAGRHADVVADAQALVAEAPMREYRWALLATAQYRAGRQGEALRTLHRARMVLRTELGLDPGPDLAALEQAILRQDPLLSHPAAGPEPDPTCPYLGLLPYDLGDADTFFGRDEQIAECRRRLAADGVLAVIGPSGFGKSSLLRAGVAAGVRRDGRTVVVITPGAHPRSALDGLLPAADPPAAVLVDQCEEVFTLCADPAERAEFLAALVAHAERAPVMIAMRADRVGDLAAEPAFARLVERGLYLLGPMTEADLRAAIQGPAQQAGLLLEPGLVDLLVREVQGEPGALPMLSHALRRTWERREGRTLTVGGYQATGGIRGSVAQSAEQLYQSLPVDHRLLLRQLLLRLVTTGADGDPLPTRTPRRLLLTDPDRERIIERLVAARLVTTDQDTIQIAHESLARAWPLLASWLDEDVDGLRILRHLTATADAWDALDRPDSELYRGLRLSQALDWRDRTHPDLTSTEAAFLDGSRAARDAERRAAERAATAGARSRRRTRWLLAGGVVLLIAALAAGLLAVRQQQQREAADLAALVAEASRVDDASRTAQDVDAQLLYAVEAVRLHDSPETRAVLLDLLAAHPALVRVLPTGPVQSLDVSPDGAGLLVGTDAGTDLYATATLEKQPALLDSPSIAEYRSDGAQVALAAVSSRGLGEADGALSAGLLDPRTGTLTPLTMTGIAGIFVSALDVDYSANGQYLALYAEGSGTGVGVDLTPLDSAVAVWAVAAIDRPIMRIQPRLLWGLAISPDGRRLYLGSQGADPALELVEVATGRTLRTTPVPLAGLLAPRPGAADQAWTMVPDRIQVSPDGRTLAVAEGNTVVLYDAATLARLGDMQGHTGLVRALRFSPDGRVLASGADDATTIVWDVAARTPVSTLTGHSDSVTSLAFGADGRTIYTGGPDGRVLVWDLGGDRRFLPRIVAGEPGTTVAGVARPAPHGQTVVYAGATASGSGVRFLDVAEGRLGPSGPDPDGSPIAAWLPDSTRVGTAADREVRVWDAATGERIAQRSVAGADITALAATPDGTSLIVGAADGTVGRVDAQTLGANGPAVPLGSPVTAVAAAPDGHTAVALLDDMTYAVVDLADGGVTDRGATGMTATAAAVSPDGERLALGGESGEVGLLELGGDWIAPPAPTHAQLVTGASFDSAGARIITTGFDGGVALWDGRTGGPLGTTTTGGSQSPAAAIVLPGEPHAVIATRDGAVYRWDVRVDSWLAFACAVAGRNLTPTEWHAALGDRPYRETCPDGP